MTQSHELLQQGQTLFASLQNYGVKTAVGSGMPQISRTDLLSNKVSALANAEV